MLWGGMSGTILDTLTNVAMPPHGPCGLWFGVYMHFSYKVHCIGQGSASMNS